MSTPPATILAVDDDPRTLMALEELLRGAGQSVVVANSGEEALRCVLKQDFAVILLDAEGKSRDGKPFDFTEGWTNASFIGPATDCWS